MLVGEKWLTRMVVPSKENKESFKVCFSVWVCKEAID